jgi:2-keto-4-pentenoate hydratase
MPLRRFDADAIATEVLAALGSGSQIEPFSFRPGGLSLEEAYQVTEALRRRRIARGERPVGRKIGFTNRNIWAEYGVYQPIWGEVFDTSLREADPDALVSVSHLPEPRIEPEIVFGLAGDLKPGLTLSEILGRMAWVAHGFEIVQSIYPGWRFAAADCVADGGLHGALLLGHRKMIEEAEREALLAALSSFSITLSCDGEIAGTGRGANVLDGPVHALAHLVEVLARDPVNPPLRAGEIVTTGTLTRAFPILPGQRWSTELDGIDLPGLSVCFG